MFFFQSYLLLSGEVIWFSSLTGFSTCLTGVSQLDRPVTYCLEGSCSIQLSYETDIYLRQTLLSET